MATGKFVIQGMRGEEDAKRVDETLRGVWGIQDVNMLVEKAEVNFRYDERAASYQDLKQALIDQGFGVVDGRLSDGQRV
ncbi:heavy-metal-associated domain-containing protein [Tumebacillus sp. ITR2]|uniref:Heavy-metal-associated domain-containing protein n=1 Tax=Tumebacillus amylolyticus TaxID=2801339 RepID=A0ABS1JDL2_9BACL|nr:heavy-metal-associated domain-containing protein [Tumebacillus amylolyticus]MBL0388374.1 heavy-metal-associated domain-containing protein [Tumebacillus amylolyticus]